MASSGGKKKREQTPGLARGRSNPSARGAGSGGMAGTAGSERADKGPIRQELSSLRFAAVARRLSEGARQVGVAAPGFRSPPKTPGVRRSIRRESDGSATVSVALRGRPGIAVVGDMIDGIVSASGLSGVEAGAVRDELWSAVAGLLDDEYEARGPLPAKLAA